MKINSTPLIFAAVLAGFLPLSQSFAAAYVWDGGGANTRYSTTGNWDPTSPTGGPQSGDTGTVGGSFVVSVGTASEITTGAEITFNGSSSLQRNSTSNANMSGTFNFNDSSTMVFSALTLTGGTLNFNSSGTFNSGSLGLASIANFIQSGGTTNMSNGIWTLDASATDSMQVTGGTFNLTGGSITNLDRFRLESTFNLGGTGELYAADEFMDTGAVFNFQGTSSSFFLAGFDQNLDPRITSGFIYVNGVQQTDASLLQFSNVNVGGTDYTKISAIPEPATAALLTASLAAMFFARRRRVGQA